MADCERCGERAGLGKSVCGDCAPIIEAEKERERREQEERDRENEAIRRREIAEKKQRLAKDKEERLQQRIEIRKQQEQERQKLHQTQLERRQRYLDSRFAHLKSLLDSGVTPFVYDHITIDSQSFFGDRSKVGFWNPEIHHKTNTVGRETNLEVLQRRGLHGWEVVTSIPVTYGSTLTNHVGDNLAYAGGYGGMVIGAQLLLRLPITSATIESNKSILEELFLREYNPRSDPRRG